MTRRLDLGIDEVDHGDDLRLEFEGQPFTGEVVETIGDQLLSQVFYVNGIPHGPDREWWADGILKSEGQVRHGLPYGIFREWHHNGQLATEKHFDDYGRLLTVNKWDENGSPLAD